jgi:hypothetical protein
VNESKLLSTGYFCGPSAGMSSGSALEMRASASACSTPRFRPRRQLVHDGVPVALIFRHAADRNLLRDAITRRGDAVVGEADETSSVHPTGQSGTRQLRVTDHFVDEVLWLPVG